MSQINNSKNLAYLLLLCAPILANASPAVVYDGWSSNNGIIDTSASCSVTGISCTTLAEDNGFLQQQVVNHHGTYIRTILIENGATGDSSSLGFASETFIPQDNKTGFDINTKQVIRDINEGFESTAVIERNPFNNQNDDLVDLLNVELTQTLSNNDFSSNFKLDKYEAEISDGSSYSGRSLDISQLIVDDTTGAKGAFDYREREGAVLSNVDNQLDVDPFTKNGNLTLGSETFVWNEGDHLKSIWVAQVTDSELSDPFAYQSIENVDVGVGIKTHSFSEENIIDPFDWDETTLGQAPTLP